MTYHNNFLNAKQRVMKSYIKTKEDRHASILLAVLVILLIAYSIAMFLWMQGRWNVPLQDLTVKDGVQGAIWASTGRLIYRWMKKNAFKSARG